MKKLITLLVLGLFIISHSLIAQDWVKMMQDPKVNFFEVQKAFNKYYEKAKAEKEKEKKFSNNSGERTSEEENEESQVPGYTVYKRWEWYMAQRVSETGERPAPDAVWKAMEEYNGGNRAASAGNWSYIGNTTVAGLSGAGRVNFMRVHPTIPTTIFIGSPAGGLWKSTDGGSTWSSNTDFLAQTIGCSDLAIDPLNPNIMYLATGDGDASDTYSVGLLKSTDGGLSWKTTGFSSTISQTRIMSRVIVHPTSTNIVLVATSAGIYRSTDAGVTFTLVQAGGFKDMEFKPTAPATIYACGAEFYKSTNTGATWTKITSGLPVVANVSRMALATTANDPTYVYLIVGLPAPGYGTEGFYKSTTSGGSFTKVSTPNIGTQQWYDLAIAACPGARDEVLLGGQTQFLKSVNGGTSWSTIGGTTHVDYHDLVYTSATNCYVTSDGGVWSSTDNGVNWTNRSNGLPISQIYGFGQSNTNANLQLHGWQDNGTSRYNGSWYQAMGGDGMLCFIGFNNDNLMWGSQYEGSLNKSTNGGSSFTACKGNIPGIGSWVTPWLEDPVTANTIYAGFADIWKHTSGGGTTGWVQISNFGFPALTYITQMAVSPADNKVIWATGGGKLFKTTNGGTNWTTITGIPSGTISYIACHNTNAQKAWITYSGFNSNNKVFQTNDQGTSWTNLSASLPNIPMDCITYVKGSNDGLYLGTDVGAYYRDATMSYWQSFSNGLPNVAVSQISIFYPTNKIRCSTYGRGMWESSSFVPGIYSPKANFASVGSISCPGAGVKFTDQSAGQPTAWNWSFPGGTPSTSTLQNPYIAYNVPGTYPVTLIVTNSVGADTLTYNSHVVIATSSIPAPTTTGASSCAPATVNLSASGSGTGTLRWWDAPGGGNIVKTGATYSPFLSVTTTFYVDEALPQKPDELVPCADINGPGSSFTANDIRGLYFDVLSPVILNQVLVLAGSDGDRTIEILDPSGSTIMDTTVFIPTGLNPVALNFKIYPGNQYFIKCRGLVDLFRNTAGAVYPYTSPSLNITESNASLPGYYYFFYDWQYTPLPCNTSRTPVTGNIGCVGMVDVITNGSLNVFPNPNEGTFDLSFNINDVDDYTITIYNTLGQSVYNESLKNFSGKYSKKIDITSFGPGIYMMNLSDSKDDVTRRIIKN